MSIVDEAAVHARGVYPLADLAHIAEVEAYARLLAEQTGADEEIVTLAAFFHDISRVTLGPEQHNIRSAQMAREWLGQHSYPQERTERVAAAILAHMLPAARPEREHVPIESRILYDADKISRAQGMGLVGALVRLGQQVSRDDLSYAQLAVAIRRGRDITAEAYSTLYTDAARDLAGSVHRHAVEFCDGLLRLKCFEIR